MYQHVANVRSFMQQAGQDLPATPTVPDAKTRILRAKLILEEAMETIEKGLGLQVEFRTPDDHPDEPYFVLCEENVKQAKYRVVGDVNLVEVADGCADVLVVTTGTALACGINPVPIQNLVDQANLAKFGPGGYRREDGKWIKPPDWEAPDIAGELEAQRRVDVPASIEE